MGIKPVNRWLLPFGLFMCCFPAIGFGGYRAYSLALENSWILQFLSEHVDNLPLFIHVVFAGLFLVLGALQVLPAMRKRYRKWHKQAGKVAIVSGFIGGLSGFWMVFAHPNIAGPILQSGRALVSMLWVMFLIFAIQAIKQRDFKTHGEWMLRAFIMMLPAGTLAFIMFPIVLIVGEEGNELFFEIVQVLAWFLHLAVAEWIIRRPKLIRTHVVTQ